ncbi:MAG: dolichyl-phosphate beta-glucosyltransferase [Thermodesulfobacteriota bacterium]
MESKTSDGIYLSVIVPAYNEQSRIESTVRSIESYLSGRPYTSEVVVVDDGSTDGTAAVVRRLASEFPALRLHSCVENSGKGYAVAQGMLNSGGRYRLFMDADNSTTVDQFERMIPHFEAGAGVVIGSRRVEGALIEVHQSRLRETLGQVFNLLVRLLYGFSTRDTQAGFKAFTSEAARAIFPMQTIRRWAFDIEILVIAGLLGIRVREVPITWRNDPITQVKPGGMIRMLFDVIKVRVNMFMGVYKRRSDGTGRSGC